MKKVVIIGAGIAGLTAAVYCQRSGFDTTLVEQHNIVGGMCTSWKRKGYFFEGAVNWLTGSSDKTALNKVWRETGALTKDTPVYTADVFRSVEYDGGKVLNIYRSIEKTKEELLRVSPEDKKAILELYKDVKKSGKVEMPIMDIKGVKCANPHKMKFGDIFEMVGSLPAMNRLMKISVKDYVSKFKHPAIRRALNIVPEEYSATGLVFTLGTLNFGDGGYPEGGSLPMVGRMKKTFEALGGRVKLGTKVDKIIEKDGRAVGVKLENETLDADAVIVTQETIAAVHQLFEKVPTDPWVTRVLEETISSVCTFIGIGIKAKLPQTPTFILDTPIKYADKQETELGFTNYSEFKGYAPEGCTTLTTALMGDTYDFWKQAKEEGRYEEEKEKLAKQIETALNKKYPETIGKIEVIDIATPITYERYTGAYHGSWMSVMTPQHKMAAHSGELESVKGVYFAGHRMQSPGGLPVALVTGRTAAQHVCREFDVVFQNK